MYVRIYSTETVDVFPCFDEALHRVTRDLKYEDWGEFLIVWRMDRIEIYENYVSLFMADSCNGADDCPDNPRQRMDHRSQTPLIHYPVEVLKNAPVALFICGSHILYNVQSYYPSFQPRESKVDYTFSQRRV